MSTLGSDTLEASFKIPSVTFPFRLGPNAELQITVFSICFIGRIEYIFHKLLFDYYYYCVLGDDRVKFGAVISANTTLILL